MKISAYDLTFTFLFLASQAIAQNSKVGHLRMAPISRYLMPRDEEISNPAAHLTVFLIPVSRWSDGTLSRAR